MNVKILVLAIVVVLIIVLALVVLFANLNNRSQPAPSGETVQQQAQEEPDSVKNIVSDFIKDVPSDNSVKGEMDAIDASLKDF